MQETEKNLKEAFAGESQANRTYLAFAARAEKDGFPQAARLFRAAAEAETVHALAHLRALGIVKGTADNLKAAIEGETHEFTSMYPAMIEAARKEGNGEALSSFIRANKVEAVHAGLYGKALDAVASGKDLPAGDIYVCEVCGNTVSEVPGTCPVCAAGKDRFKKVL